MEWPPAEALARASFDVTHSLHPLLLPARRAAQVVTIHDLNFLLHPERTRAEIKRDYPALARDHAHRADRVIVVSEFTAREVERLLQVPRHRISVCPPGAPPWTPRSNRPTPGYVLFLGTLEPRKNVGVLLDAYERLAGSRATLPPLVLAGKASDGSAGWLERIERAPLKGVVRHIGYVDPAARRELYEGAQLLVQPSFEEGFGLPVLEAMTLGVPVVAANRGALPEVVGDAGPLVDPNDADAMAHAIASILDDPDAADAATARGLRQSTRYTWANTASTVYEAYQAAIAHRSAGAERPRLPCGSRSTRGSCAASRPESGRYLAGLLKQWARCDTGHAHQFALYAHERPVLPLSGGSDITSAPNLEAPASPTRPPGASAPRFSTHLVAGSGGTWWEQVALPAALSRDRPDLFFAPGYTAPLRLPVPLVVAIHDVSFAAHPEWFGAREGLRRRFLSRRAAAAAAAVITISEFSRGELVEQLGVDPARIHVIPPGIDGPLDDQSDVNLRSTAPPETSAGMASAGTTPTVTADWASTTPGDHVLYVGSIFNRRRIPDLVRAFSLVARAHPTVTLDLVGDNRTYPRQDIDAILRREELSGSVHWRRYVTEDALVALYRRARAFAFLSEYEGLGLTPLEALAAGIPAVLLDTPVARESCGPAALYAQPGDLNGIARAIEQILFDERTRTRLLAAAPGVLARYNWPEAGRQTLALLERAALGAA